MNQLKSESKGRFSSQNPLLTALTFILISAVTGLPLSARADLVLSEIILDFEPGSEMRRDVFASNNGEETLYIEATVDRVIDPGQSTQRRERVSDPLKGGLLVTPNKLILQPGDRKPLRFLLTKGLGDEELVFRATVVPKTSGVALDNKKPGAKTTGVKVMIGYDVLVIARPKEMKPSIDVKREGKKLTATNKGNTNVLLLQIRQCTSDDQDRESCPVINGPRVYPGRTGTVDLPLDRPIELYQQIGKSNSVSTH